MKHKLLVVDDHPETLDIISSVLSQNEYDVISTQHSQEGLHLAQRELPDLILVDGMMPEMDGWTFIRHIREMPLLQKTPIIMFSAVEASEQKLASFEAGADDYLTKPTQPDELLDRVHALLAHVTPRAVESSTPPQVESDTTEHSALMTRHVPGGQKNETTALTPASTLIAVIGARGGAGTTTTAINIATCLAALALPTTLLDMDVIQGHVALYLKQKVSDVVKGLPTTEPDGFKTAVSQALVPQESGLNVLFAPTNRLGSFPTYSYEQAIALVETVATPGMHIVVDVGAPYSASNQAILAHADQVLLCVKPERVSLAAARKMIVQWQKERFSISRVTPLVIQFDGGREVPIEAIRTYLSRPVVGPLPVQSSELAKAVNRGEPLVSIYPDSPTAVLFQQLTQQLIGV